MALLNIGTILEWGGNEFGQLGNKKRVFSEDPMILAPFKNENVKGVFCGYSSSAVIIENNDTLTPSQA